MKSDLFNPRQSVSFELQEPGIPSMLPYMFISAHIELFILSFGVQKTFGADTTLLASEHFIHILKVSSF